MKQKQKKNYNRWCHMRNITWNIEAPRTLCGKYARRIVDTADEKKVTCPRCLEKLRKEKNADQMF